MSAPSLLGGADGVPNHAFATAYSQPRRPLLTDCTNPDADSAEPSADSLDTPRALDAVDRLALSLADLCRSAVDSLAIAAGLEAEGYNDRIAAERFGLPDLFALAEELHRRVPRDPHSPDASDDQPNLMQMPPVTPPTAHHRLTVVARFAASAECGGTIPARLNCRNGARFQRCRSLAR